ncbi:MAG: hypothetical protein AAB353_10855, partial [Candidatus Hydrogenedentota bacterium]
MSRTTAGNSARIAGTALLNDRAASSTAIVTSRRIAAAANGCAFGIANAEMLAGIATNAVAAINRVRGMSTP